MIGVELEFEDAQLSPEWVARAGARNREGAVVLVLSRAVHLYVATEPCCLRKSFEGLANEVRQALAKDPLLARRVRLADIPAMMPAAWKRSRATP